MAVSAVTLLFNGQTGERDSDSTRTYTAVYNVTTDDVDDGPQVVVDADGLPQLSSVYSFGNDYDNRAFLKKLVPTRDAGNRFLWHVTATWETPESSKNKEGSGDPSQGNQPTSNPELWHDDIEVSNVKFQTPVDRANYNSGYKASIHDQLVALSADPATRGPIVSSALVPFDPPLERDSSRVVIRVGKWLKAFPNWLTAYVDSVNASFWQINKPAYGFQVDFPEFTAKINSVTGTFQIVNQIAIWKVYVEVEYRQDDWSENVLDRGTSRKRPVQTIGQPIVNSPVDRIVDVNGSPISEPVLLDGKGGILDAGLAPIYSNWDIYPYYDFSPIVL